MKVLQLLFVALTFSMFEAQLGGKLNALTMCEAMFGTTPLKHIL